MAAPTPATTRRTLTVPDPAEIQQQIEETRAELASTIDAIAERVNPKRVASRGVESVKGKVEDLRSRGTSPNGAAANGAGQLPARVAAQLQEARKTRGRSVRWDRVAIAGGGLLAVILLLRRRGH
jgi:hypothetical protein